MYLKPYFGVMRLDAITDFAIEKYKKRRLDQRAAEATVSRELATLSHLLNQEWWNGNGSTACRRDQRNLPKASAGSLP